MQSFFSETLTVLHLTECQDVPLTLFLIFPRLREIVTDEVTVTWKKHDKLDEQCSGRELPALEHLSCRNSVSFIKYMFALPPRFHTIWFGQNCVC
jgi:hypothetical protein